MVPVEYDAARSRPHELQTEAQAAARASAAVH
jgi:hypothetical protein